VRGRGPGERRWLGAVGAVLARALGRGAGHRAPADEDLSVRSTPELCARWEATTGAVRTCRSAFERDRLARERARHLDELERRDPRGFARWLQADPLATPPGRFLHADH
jgi:hypothetical protein